jgi:hypothetical protein
MIKKVFEFIKYGKNPKKVFQGEINVCHFCGARKVKGFISGQSADLSRTDINAGICENCVKELKYQVKK